MEYIIRPGDTLFAVARRFGITLERLLAANPQITNPAVIFPGQRIRIPVVTPPSQAYIVQAGDTLIRIAQRFGITLGQLLAANPQITNADLIFTGQRILIPAAAPPPPSTITYIIQPGDTLYLIARRFNTAVETLLRLNPQITNSARIFPGQRIQVPAPISAGPSGCIVYVSTRSGRPELWRSSASGQGAVQITRESGTTEQPVSNPQWAPNGRFIGYLAVGGLFVIDPCGRMPALLAPNANSFSWSHDSTRIAFSNPEGTFITDLAGNARKIADTLDNPVWFPGDTGLAGSVPETDEIRTARLATVDATGANFRIIESVPARIVKLSSNGRYAATQFFRGFAFGVFSTVYIYDFNTGNLSTLPGLEVEVSPGVVRNISFLGGWAPDSARLVYSTIISAAGAGEIKIANPQGALLQRFDRNYYPVTDWSPAADWIIFTVSLQPGEEFYTPTTPRNIYARNLFTGQEVLAAGTGDNYGPDWINVPCPPC
ncbi:MAG: LysM peptidoglycan-binding domain-containing protein [Bacillota bacterium]